MLVKDQLLTHLAEHRFGNFRCLLFSSIVPDTSVHANISKKANVSEKKIAMSQYIGCMCSMGIPPKQLDSVTGVAKLPCAFMRITFQIYHI